ncbi:MAG TPA: Eco57I restriction-modification methylase domain-containing protein, partial [Thomasclavelia ramosa]|nr:Eco57I restriction-modification methylase domain-containing protein [Thomasclavelia ramosa]
AVRKQEIINNNMSLDIFDDIMDVYRNDLRKKITAYYSCCNHEEKRQLLTDIHENILKQIDEQRLPVDLHDLDIQANDKFFLWHTWFSDVFNRPNGCNGFDIVIGNPPYFLYQESHLGEINNIRKDKDYNIAFGGKLNAYKLFIANALNKLLSKNGVNCFIFQNSFLGDRQATKLRYNVLSENKILNIDSYPERDSKKKRVFESVKMSVCIMLVQKSKVSSNYNFPVNIWDDKETTTGIHTIFSFDDICSIDKVDYTIPRIRQKDKALVVKLIKKKEIAIKCIEGELNMTFHKKYFTNKESYPLILKGAAIQRYFYTKQMSQGKIEYLDEERYLKDCGNTEKSKHHNLD